MSWAGHVMSYEVASQQMGMHSNLFGYNGGVEGKPDGSMFRGTTVASFLKNRGGEGGQLDDDINKAFLTIILGVLRI